MTSVFTRIIEGELPGRFAYADDQCVVIATIEPIVDGHMLVIPRTPVADFVDADDAVLGHLICVAKRIGLAQQQAYPGTRAALIIAGFDVPHLHLHVFPARDQKAMTFARAHTVPDESLDAACAAVRSGLQAIGYGQYVPASMTRL